MFTKLQLIEEAFAEIGLGNAFNVGTEEVQVALRRLDTMMAQWAGIGLHLGYLMPTNPGDSSTADASGLPDDANEAVYLNLAVKIAPGYGKTISPDTKASARAGYLALLRKAVQPVEQQMPNTMPRGAGNKPWRATAPFFPTPQAVLDADGAPITFEGQHANY